MKMIKTTVATLALSLISTAAFAGPAANAPAAQHNEAKSTTVTTRHIPQPAVLIDANPYATATAKRRITRIEKLPVEMPIARDASIKAGSPFLFKNGKNTNTKTYVPMTAKTATMPNLFKK